MSNVCMAKPLKKRLIEKLMQGWNPWIETMQPLEYTKFDDVCDKYQDYLMKLYKERGMREDSVSSYLSRLRVLRKWKEVEKVNLFYSYQFNKNIVGQFLDYIFIDRNNTIRTRNNYLTWLKVFCKYLVERGYVPKKSLLKECHLLSEIVN